MSINYKAEADQQRLASVGKDGMGKGYEHEEETFRKNKFNGK